MGVLTRLNYRDVLRWAGRIVFGKLLPRRRYTVISGPLEGAKFILGSLAGEGGGGSVYFGLVDKEQTAAVCRELRSGQTFFDLGANVGYYSILASRLVGSGGSVVAFEPVVRNVAFLHQHLMLNRAENVHVLPFAVSATTGLSSFSPGESNAMGKLGTGDMLVATVTLDEIARILNQVPDVIKIDVEGAEMEVFRGAKRILEERRPKIFLSTHSDELRTECLDHLRGLGYVSEPLVRSDDPHEFFVKHKDI
jgi:FkbM family methyltransferase